MLIEELSRDECLAVIDQSRLARLGCARENQPYIVPVYVALGESDSGELYLYGFTTPGQKIEWMRDNPKVCVEWDQVVAFNRWTSVVAVGVFDELTGDSGESDAMHGRSPASKSPPGANSNWSERARAHQLLQQQADWWQPGFAVHKARSAQGQSGSQYVIVYYRIRIDLLTGRRATP